MDDTSKAIRLISLRLVPYICLLYFIAFLDRVNVGFAAIRMNVDLGLSATAFGTGAGIFFIGYLVFEIPSNIILQKFGAKYTVCRIMVLWGIVSFMFAFIQNETEFYILRFLLGVAEAGFLPGIIYYLTLWLPPEYRARVMGLFLMMIPASSVIGAPLSTWLMSAADGMHGLHGWQWMFIIEALPAVLLGISVIRFLPNSFEEVNWLTPAQKKALSDRLAAEGKVKSEHLPSGWFQAIANVRTAKIIGVFSSISFGLYGVGFWMPQITKTFGQSLAMTGLITAIPYLCASIAMVAWGKRSDRMRERMWHVTLPLWFGGAAFMVAYLTLEVPVLATLALSGCVVGIFCALPPYMTYPTTFFSVRTVAIGIAFVNSVGNLAGYLGPMLVGVLRDATGNFGAGLLLIGGVLFLGGAIAQLLRRDFRIEGLSMMPASTREINGLPGPATTTP